MAGCGTLAYVDFTLDITVLSTIAQIQIGWNFVTLTSAFLKRSCLTRVQVNNVVTCSVIFQSSIKARYYKIYLLIYHINDVN